jgi:hypothetical protein
VKQGRTDAISFLRQILDMKSISGNEKHELEDTIRALEDPEGYEKEIEETEKELSDATQKADV